MTASATPDWQLARRLYEETDVAAADIVKQARVPRPELDARRKREKWRRSKPRVFPPLRRSKAATPETAPIELSDVRIEAEAEPLAAPSSPRERGGVTGLDTNAGGTDAALPQLTAQAPKPTRRPAPAATRRRLLERLVEAISMKLEQLERRMTKDLEQSDDTPATDHERETRAIGALIDNLEKITEMEAGNAAKAGKRGPAAVAAGDLADEAERCRRELAQRLQRIVEAAAGEA